MKFKRVSEERYYEMLGIVPPAYGGDKGFLVGEPADHQHGQPRFMAFIEIANKFFEALEPMTVEQFRSYSLNDMEIQ